MKMRRVYAAKLFQSNMMKTRTIPNEELIPEFGRLVQEGAEVVFRPKGMSMLPFIRGGKDSVALVKAEGLKVGDIVLAKVRGGAFVLHRIDSMVDDVIVLMGDGNLAGKERCTADDVLAVAARILKDNKEIDCRSARHMRRAMLWKRLLPVRRYLLAIYRRIYL